MNLPNIDSFVSSMVNNPINILILLGYILALFFLLRKLVGGSSRKEWYKEAKIRAKAKSQEISEEDARFVKSKGIRRKLVYSIVVIAILSMPATGLYLIDTFYVYGPVIIDYWFVILIIYIVYRTVKALNSMLNLQLLAKKIQKQKED